MKHQSIVRFALAFLGLSLLGACSSDGGGGGGGKQACTPNSTMACVGANNCSGVQVCSSNGAAYSPCSCGTGSGGSGNTGNTGGVGNTGNTGNTGGVGNTGGTCTDTGYSCSINSECCSFQQNDGFCVNTGSGSLCADGCASNSECNSNCCAPLESGGSVCAPAEYCQAGAGIGDPCSTSADCSEGTCNGTWCTTYCSSNTDCGFNSAGDFNWCVTTTAGSNQCFPGCSVQTCSKYPGTSCGSYQATNGSYADICSF